jgi:hypothetical protein
MGDEMQNTNGFFGSLFDLSFTSLVTTRIIKVLYVLAIIVIGIEALAWIFLGFHQSAGLGVLMLFIVAPIFGLLALIYTRVLLEVVIALFRIMENTGELVARANPEGPAIASAFPSGPQGGSGPQAGGAPHVGGGPQISGAPTQ